MTDPRLERLRQLDEAATPAPWDTARGYLHEPNGYAVALDKPDEELIAAARNILPAVIELVEGVLERHLTVWNETAGVWYCEACDFTRAGPEDRCWEHRAALAVLG